MVDGEHFKRLAHRIRAIPGKPRFGLRPHSVSLLLRSWTGANSGDGYRDDELTAILENGQNPKIRWASSEDIAVGSLEQGDVNIGPLTADHSGRTILGTLQGETLGKGEARYVVITGPKHPNGARYRVKNVNPERGLHYMMVAYPSEEDSA